MEKQYLTTKKQVMDAIKAAKEVYVQPRFGCIEMWTRIPKTEAYQIMRHLDATDTPNHVEMYGGSFGTFDGDFLYLG